MFKYQKIYIVYIFFKRWQCICCLQQKEKELKKKKKKKLIVVGSLWEARPVVIMGRECKRE